MVTLFSILILVEAMKFWDGRSTQQTHFSSFCGSTSMRQVVSIRTIQEIQLESSSPGSASKLWAERGLPV